MKLRHDDDEIRDGQRLRVPMTLMDSMDPVQQDIARDGLRITDGQGGTVGLHRPGFRLAANSEAAMSAHDAAYEHYERALTASWAGKPSAVAEPTDKQVDKDMSHYELYDSALREAWRR